MEEGLNKKLNDAVRDYIDAEFRNGKLHRITLDGRFTAAELRRVIEIIDDFEGEDDIDREIDAMSDEEIIEAVKKSAGSMPDYPEPER